jgi:hypothetical protein
MGNKINTPPLLLVGGYLFDMKIIITEDQHDKVVKTQARNWVRRNFNLIKDELETAFKFTKDDVCRYDTYEKFESYFFSVFMDCLHPYYFDIEHDIYLNIESKLVDLFYVDCTEFYFAGRERC